jgi:hypothetical protein
VIWLQPLAAAGLLALAAPLLIHLLVHRRATPVTFPTLRFLRPTRLAALRRQALDELPLLAIRVAILAAAVAAAAGPLVVTAARRTSWNNRVARAVVIDGGARAGARQTGAFRSTTIESASLADGVRRATRWLDRQPPSRREIVVASAFPIGSLTDQDVADVPASIGLRFERAAALPSSASADGPVTLGTSDGAGAAAIHRTRVVLDREWTRVAEREDGVAPLPISIDAPPADRAAADAAVAAVLSERAPSAAAGRKARLVIESADGGPSIGVEAIHTDWMGAAAAAVASDDVLARALADVTTGFRDRAFASNPWQPIGRAADGTPVVSAAAGHGALVVSSAIPASNIATPLLVRALLDAIAATSSAPRPETLAISDAKLREWAREAGTASAMDIRGVERDDRRWPWAAALLLLAAESWLRKSSAPTASARAAERTERAHVA